MADYSKEEIRKIEEKWQRIWEEKQLYRVENHSDKPKYYVLDMFPYPSGAGLHVGHPLGYIASDIVSRYKRLQGFNVLHPMGFDAFGLPAEQYAIQTGQHPAITTAKNIETYKRQLRQIGFSYDWSREVQTCDPAYYKWTQWIFAQLFNAWYNLQPSSEHPYGKAETIDILIHHLNQEGNALLFAVCDEDTPIISAEEWLNKSEKDKEAFLQHYRIAYQSETMVNWCAALGTVLSNDEVKDGVSERGGYPVERMKMLQWSMRISAYAERLLTGLDTIDWPEAVKEMQRNWIGKSRGCELNFFLANDKTKYIKVFTTRIDTIYGVTFLVVAPEHELVEEITTTEQKNTVQLYVEQAKNRSERERMADVKRVSGAFTGSYAVNPFNGEQIPIWISDYVLAGYGTGAVMAVPGHDERDHRFAKHFHLPIIQVVEGPSVEDEAFVSWDAKIINSDFLNGLTVDEAIEKGIEKVESLGIGYGKTNYRMRDAIFGRQRYWGEPFPVYYKNGIPQIVPDSELPIVLPEIDEYKPTASGEPPLARAKGWGYIDYSTSPNKPHPQPLSEVEGSKEAFEEAVYLSSAKQWDALKPLAKENRIQQTTAEEKLWNEIRNSKLGYKFRRQHAIDSFIVDFVCIEKKLVIELDGEIHNFKKEEDANRTSVLNQFGFEVIRFKNEEVLNKLLEVIKKIETKLNSPSPAERGQGGEVKHPFELTTMPGWAGSSWYWFRYMDPQNDTAFCDSKIQKYWKDVDLYMGGSEHATGHLLYSRFWCKALRDLGFVEAEEPFKKLINQGHIQGMSKFVYRINGTNKFVSSSKKTNFETTALHVDISFVDGDKLDVEKFKNWRDDFRDAEFILEDDGSYLCGTEVEKMSKSKYNVVNPDEIVNNYGADTLRLYEMFLGPLELSKPWNVQGIDGVYKFLRRFWNLFHDKQGNFSVTDEEATAEELKVLHKTLKKVAYDIENFSFNTTVSEFMICANQLSSLNCKKRSILEPLCIALAPYAPHITEELWSLLGHTDSIFNAKFPVHDEKYLTESSFEYPISINGKVRSKMTFPIDAQKEIIEKTVIESEVVRKWLEGKTPKKIIVVPNKIVNVVV
jgi:leucyl-tRNA synthetase/very-short-patch-repair endonuclease